MSEILSISAWHLSNSMNNIAPVVHYAWWISLDKKSPNHEAATNLLASIIQTYGRDHFNAMLNLSVKDMVALDVKANPE